MVINVHIQVTSQEKYQMARTLSLSTKSSQKDGSGNMNITINKYYKKNRLFESFSR
jgi:hypothetical protein